MPLHHINALYNEIDHAVLVYTQAKIEDEIHKNIEDVIFFSSYTIGASVFRKATNKLKKKIKEKDFSSIFLWEEEAQKLIQTYQLNLSCEDTKAYEYLLTMLMKAQIKINEAILFHFSSLHKKAHNFDYFERRIEEIHALLFETSEKLHD